MSGRGRGGDRGGGQGGGRGQRGGRGGGGPDRGGSGQRGQHQGGGRGGGSYDRGGSSQRGQYGGGRGDGGQRGGFTQQTAARIFLEGETHPPSDPRVTKAENDQISLIKDKNIDGFPTRPGYGNKGKPFEVRVNMFELRSNTTLGKTPVPLHKYNIDFVQEGLPKNKKAQLVQAILQRPEFRIQGMQWTTDYSNIIVTTQKLKSNFEGKAEAKNPLDDDMPGQPTTQAARDAVARREEKFKVTLEDTFALQDLFSYLNRTQHGQEYEGRVDVVQLLNIIISKPCRDSNMISAGGQNAFFPIRGHPCFSFMDLGGGLSAYRGFFSSVRYSTGRVLVNLNVSNGAFFKDIPLRDLIADICGRNPKATDKASLARLEPILKHLKVMTQYMVPRDANGKALKDQQPLKKVKTMINFAKQFRRDDKGNIIDFRYQSCKDVKFSLATAPGGPVQTVSVFEYFKQYHRITLQHPDEPPINVGNPANATYLPQELCNKVLPGQPYRGLLQGDQTSKMIRFAATNPGVKAAEIQGSNSDGKGLEMMKLREADQEQSVHHFGFDVEPRMVTAPARRLAPPQLEYGRAGNQRATVTPSGGSWNLQNRASKSGHHNFFKPGAFQRWQTLTISLDGSQPLFNDALVNDLRRFDADLRTYGLVMGQKGPDMECSVPNPAFPSRDGLDEDRRKTNEILREKFGLAVRNQVNIMLVILNDQNAWLYSRVKIFGDVTHGINTVCCINNKFMKPGNQGMLWGNLALKFNIKGGGVNHKISMEQLKPFDSRTILVGIDVTHPSPTSTDDAPSIAAVVANKDQNLCEWPASLRVQQRRQEIVDELKDMVMERFSLWRECNGGALPNKVIVYRDGVSEGQYQAVLTHEKAAFDKVFNELYGTADKHPKLAIFIVGKRHHIRAFAIHGADADPKGNLLPGTIIDRGITHPTRHDFYLQAHAVLQGTGRSAHYDTIKDDIRFTADDLQTFTHNLSYLFNRATKSVSVVPPAYYADLACERGRQYLHSVLQESRASGSKKFDPKTAEWTRGVHSRLAKTTFYI